MKPILFEFGPVTLRFYGLMVAMGFLAAFALFRKRAIRLGLNEGEASNLILLLFISGILGARTYYVLWNWGPLFSGHPSEIFMVQHGGLVFYGGFLAACAALIAWCRWKKRSFASLADALSPPLALGHAFGRLGCFMNGCCYGRACDFPWAVRLNAPPEIAGIPVHPTQLYEFLGLLDILVALLVIEKMVRYPGQVALSYGILYSLLRFIIEFFRGDVAHDVLGRFTLAQIVSIAVFLTAWGLSTRLSYRAAKARSRRALDAGLREIETGHGNP